MAIKTSSAMNGFISDDPRLTYGQDGTARFYARVGVKHFERVGDGQFKRLSNSYHDLIQFGKGAELSYERFSKGDEFLAQGQVRDYTREVDGQERTDEQFVATRISHDPNTTTYTVERRTPAAEREGTQRESVDRDSAERDGAARENAEAGRDTERQARLGQAEPVAQDTATSAEALAR